MRYVEVFDDSIAFNEMSYGCWVYYLPSISVILLRMVGFIKDEEVNLVYRDECV